MWRILTTFVPCFVRDTTFDCSTFSVELAPRNEIIGANLFTRSMRHSADFPFVNRGSARPDRENGWVCAFFMLIS